MPDLHDLITRLRPAGAPGPAGGVGVPADRRQCAERELEPVFARLMAVVDDRRRMLADGAAAAAAREARAREQARALTARADAESAATRAEVAAALRAAAETGAVASIEAAKLEAQRIRDAARARLDERVAAVLARVRQYLREPAG